MEAAGAAWRCAHANPFWHDLYNVSAAKYPSADNPAIPSRTGLTKNMSAKEMEAAQKLTRELAKPKNLLVALDKYIEKPAIKEPQPIR